MKNVPKKFISYYLGAFIGAYLRKFCEYTTLCLWVSCITIMVRHLNSNNDMILLHFKKQEPGAKFTNYLTIILRQFVRRLSQKKLSENTHHHHDELPVVSKQKGDSDIPKIANILY